MTSMAQKAVLFSSQSNMDIDELMMRFNKWNGNQKFKLKKSNLYIKASHIYSYQKRCNRR